MGEGFPKENHPFQILKQLGDGGFGTVQLVDHTRFGIVAFKSCPGTSTESKAELESEAEQHRTLHHPNVVTLYDAVFNSQGRINPVGGPGHS